MSDPIDIPAKPRGRDSYFDPMTMQDETLLSSSAEARTPDPSSSYPTSPRDTLSRNASFSSNTSNNFEDAIEPEYPPLDRLTIFDFLGNLALPQRLEKLQASFNAQKEKVQRQRERFRQQSSRAKERVDEWRKKVPPQADEQLRKYRKTVSASVNRLSNKLTSTTVTLGEKISFIAGVLNIFISGYIVGAMPQYFHLWYTGQLVYFYPIRYYRYHKIGYHYFLADLCYFVNFLLFGTIWIFPHSKRLFISTFCLAYGNNAVAIAMWRNSLVFHSLDKVTSLFIHIMPCVTLHCLVHLLPDEYQKDNFPAIYSIRHSLPNAPEHYGLLSMALWSSVPYAIWQLSYHFFISIRRREQIAAGRPTSFTWLRRSYAPTLIGKFVLSLPSKFQEPAFMGIQYVYALLTMMPAPLWFHFRWASASFLMAVFIWSIYNGAVYYIDVFGTRFQKELEQLKADVAKWQMSPELMPRSPKTPFHIQGNSLGGQSDYLSSGGSNANHTVAGEGTELNLGAAAMDIAGGGSGDSSDANEVALAAGGESVADRLATKSTGVSKETLSNINGLKARR